MEFSTFDNDHDAWSDGNCAVECGGGGNWWRKCMQQTINAEYGGSKSRDGQTMGWYRLYHGSLFSLKLRSMTLMFKPAV